MSNNFFKFKQFIIQQDKSAMKVCTDACIFGAWISDKINELKLSINNCLDIGTGTGLLSLMIAQKNMNIKFDAVEIEKNAFEQAKENFINSSWSQRLNVIKADIKSFNSSQKYDLIISNPPFFENDLLPSSANKKIAKHEISLTLEMLINIIIKLIPTDGYFSIMLPYHRLDQAEKIIQQKNYFITGKLLLKQTSSHNFFRAILFCETRPAVELKKELTIKNNEGNYTDDFKYLLKDYYLNL